MPILPDPTSPTGRTIPLQRTDMDRLRKAGDDVAYEKAYGLDPGFRTAADHYNRPEIAAQLDPYFQQNLKSKLLNRYYYGDWEKGNAQDDLTATLGQQAVQPRGLLTRAAQSFGNTQVREQAKQQETAEGRTGFQWSDIPGDVADVAGATLPFFGSILGGLGGASVGVVGGPPGVVAGGIAGAGAGAMAGEGARQMIGDLAGQGFDPKRALKDSAVQGVVGAASEGAGQVVGKVVTKAAAPFKDSFNAGLKALYEKAGIKPTASMVSESRVVPQIEALTKKSLFGDGGYNKLLDDATQGLEKHAQDLLGSLDSTTDPTVAGKQIVEGAEKFKQLYLDGRKAVYAKAAKEMGAHAPEQIPFEETKAVLSQYIKSKENAKEILGNVPLLDRLKTIMGNLQPSEIAAARGATNRSLRYQVVSDALDELGYMAEQGGLLSTGDIARINNIKGTMQREFESFIEQHAPQAFQSLKAADAVASLGYEHLNGKAGQIINGLKDEPTKLVRALITPRSADRIPRLYSMIGHDRVPAVQGAFLQQILEESSHPATGITGSKLDGAIKKYGESTIEAALGPQKLGELRDLAKMAGGLQTGRKIAEGSQTAFLARLSAIGSTLFINPLLTAKLLLGDAALSKVVSSPVGIKWLTEGFQFSPAAKTAARAGAQAVGQGVKSLTNQQ